ncbi:hypothetical protein POM88_024871 [Heracleum sosnowskyi]|uniref:PB1-like domain-containing protein n=1 Tax=Heracleum sosnowskyi TaxID=360622 RepID=A0AAD8I2W6_9APIA|nr:hypothetical protein POM88_024871 [Heracleum sosnowskyi]
MDLPSLLLTPSWYLENILIFMLEIARSHWSHFSPNFILMKGYSQYGRVLLFSLSGRKNGSALWSQFLGELLGLLIQQQRLIVSDKNILSSLFTNLLGTSCHSILVSESVGQRRKVSQTNLHMGRRKRINDATLRCGSVVSFHSSLLDIMRLKKDIENRASILGPLFKLIGTLFMDDYWIMVTKNEENYTEASAEPFLSIEVENGMVYATRNEMHKYGTAECPNYTEYPSFFTIKLYHEGHFENLNSKFVNYKVDYFDFCNVDMMSMFEVGGMVSEAIGRKSVEIELYFKAPVEGMDEIGKLETDGDILVMTRLISKEVQYVEVFAVLIEAIAVQPLPSNIPNSNIPNSNAPVIELEDGSIEEMMQSKSSSSSTDMEQEVPVIKKKKVKKVGRKPTPKKMSARRPILDASDDFEDPGFEADVEDHGKEFDDVFEDHGNGADQDQENVFETEDHGSGGGNEDEENVVEKEDEQNVVQNEDVSSEEDEEWFPDSSNDGNSDYEEDFGEVTGEYKGFGGYVYENWDEDNLELIDEVIGGSDDEKMACWIAEKGSTNSCHYGEKTNSEATQHGK